MIPTFNSIFQSKSLSGRTLGFALAALFLFVPMVHASPEQAQKVELSQCHLDFCVQLKTEKLYKSVLARTYAFGPSEVQVLEQGKSSLKMSQWEGTFDASLGRFYLSHSDQKYDLVIDTKEQKIYRLPRS